MNVLKRLQGQRGEVRPAAHRLPDVLQVFLLLQTLRQILHLLPHLLQSLLQPRHLRQQCIVGVTVHPPHCRKTELK
ncbi:hypothetical protein CesoFtcFv8_021580 [Champsocephalus esox]|uniref:Uncharacterized protein n=1 Tax=Champsocephalus esox TaxID=159716 RepID=A0AAN8GIS4_9TELE|nr:hypothetical protein CesoFtcFv8_021580 [Champsocephalus esox]